MNKTQSADKKTQLAKVVFIIGIILWVIGGGMLPLITVFNQDSPTDGPAIIDHWETFRHCLPAYAFFAAGGLLMTVSACYILWSSFIAGFRETNVQQVAAADGHKPGKFNSNHDAMTPRQG